MELHTETTTPIDNIKAFVTEDQPNKRKRKKSIVWDHFTVETVGAGCIRASCNQCKKSFAYITGSKLAGTSHLKRHIALGICPVSRQKNQSNGFTPVSKPGNYGNATGPPKKRYRAVPAIPSTPFDQDHCSHEIAKMIIMHEYPLHMAEQPDFIDFVKTLHPQFNMVSASTIQEDCVAMYLSEKQTLFNFISRIPGRASLSLDLWTSNQSLGYVILTGHFIDSGWKFHRRVLNVVTVSSPESDDEINQAIVTCLSDWHLEGRIFTITIDHFLLSNTIVGKLRSFLSPKNTPMLNGQLVLGSCYARVLSRLAQDALGSMSEVVWKIRESVKYVKTSDAQEEKFIKLKHQLQVPSTRDLSLDDQTKWDTTYHMVVAACELKQVFTCLDESDPDYKITPSMDDWKLVDILCIYLKFFYDSANILTSPCYPPSSKFFAEVSKIQIELTHAAMSLDPVVCNLTKPLQEKFDKYWKDCWLVLAIAVVMDPRFKMKLVEFTLSKMYGENADTWIKIVYDGVHELFLDYMFQSVPLLETFAVERNEVVPKMESSEEGQEDHLLSNGDGIPDFDIYISEINCSDETKSELDQYLEDLIVPREQGFDVLSWWKLNELKYPTLSKMASDILSIPVSTVAPESVFDTKMKKMDSYRSSLRPVTLEALICTKDWFQYGMLTTSSTEIGRSNCEKGIWG